MLEKSGSIALTMEEVESFRNGVVPTKLQNWNLSLDEFNALINSGQITIMHEDSNK